MFKRILVVVLALCLSGCGATHTAIKKRKLDVQTKMSQTVFLDPVEEHQKTVLIQIKNTSDKSDLDLMGPVRAAVENKGYKIVTSPKQAQFILQANVLQVGKADLRDTEDALANGYGASLTGALVGGAGGSMLSDHRDAVVGGALLGAALGLVSDALVKDVNYSIITDIQVSEKAADGVVVTETNQASLKQGTSGRKTVRSNEKHQWKRYQTRVISTANKVNLKLEDALPELVAGLTRSISGIL